MASKKDDKSGKKPEEIPRHEKDYKTFEKEFDLVQKSRDTMQYYHQDVTTKAFAKLLDEKGDLDYSKMKDAKTRKDVVSAMVKGYDKVLKDYYKTDLEDMPKQRKEYVRRSLMGINDAFLTNTADSLREKFTIDAYKNEIIDKHLEHVVQSLAEGTYAHINTEDVPKLLKLAKLDDKFDDALLDKLKDPMFKSKIGTLLYTNHATKGKFKDDLYEQLGLLPYLKKP